MRNNLGFKYSREVADLVDADEYREFLNSGRLTLYERNYLRQFLSEYYGRPTKDQLKIHGPDHYPLLTTDQRLRRRDITTHDPDTTPNKPHSTQHYSPSDYRKGSSNPEDIYIAKQQYAQRRRRCTD